VWDSGGYLSSAVVIDGWRRDPEHQHRPYAAAHAGYQRPTFRALATVHAARRDNTTTTHMEAEIP
jgi:hypothetical protein